MNELLNCPFCGSNKAYPNIELGKHWVECRECAAESGCYRTEAEAIAAWNTRATHGTLTAEQVREAVEASSWAETSTIREFNDSSWQAIADELNAELGSVTCEWVLEHSGTLYDKWRCSKCAYLFVEPRTDQGYTDLEPNFCPNCGRKVVS